MDYSQLDTRLANSLGDSAGGTWSSAVRQQAIWQSVIEYSRYRPHLRRFNTGILASAAAAGATTIQVIGGMPIAGNGIVIGQAPGPVETLIISSVSQVVTEGVQSTAIQTITLTTALASAHPVGDHYAATPVGLNLVSGTDTYALPVDFQIPEQESFDLAVGAKSAVKRNSSFYDAAYGISNSLSAAGFGSTQNYGASQPGTGYPIVGNPFNNPNSGVGNPVGQATIFRFILGGRPQLVVSPAPGQSKILDFWYWGTHSVESVPEMETETCLCYCKYWILKSQADIMASEEDYTEDGNSENPSGNAKVLLDLANAELEKWKFAIVHRPQFAVG